MDHLVIIGNGISGVTLARHVRKASNRPITIISDESPYFYSRPALMYIFMGDLTFDQTKPYEDWFWQKNNIDLLQVRVEKINPKTKRLSLKGGREIEFGQLVIATGSKTRFFGWPGQDLNGVHGMYHLEDLKAIEQTVKRTKHAVLVGGGLIGVELAEMLRTRNIEVTFLVRESNYWGNILSPEESLLIQNHMADHGVKVRLNTELKAILGEDQVEGIESSSAEKITCEFVGVTTGVTPNIGFLEGSGIETNRGVIVNSFFETNQQNIFAIGDCAEIQVGDKPVIEPLWYTGRMHAEHLAHSLTEGRKAYDRGIWFNSAKFFDIEYQTYGKIGPSPAKDEATFFWQHPHKNIFVRFIFHKDTHELHGFNAFGIRYRHQVFESWLKEKRKMPEVLKKLSRANFDPEFFKRHEKEIETAFHQQTKKVGAPC